MCKIWRGQLWRLRSLSWCRWQMHSWRHVSNLRSLVLGDPVIGRCVEVYFYQLKLHSKSKNNLIKALFGMGPYPSTHSNIWRKTHWDGDGCDFLIFSATFHFTHFYDSIRLDGVSRDSFTWLEATSIIQICFIDTFKITGGKGSKFMGQVSILVITEGWTLVPTLQGFPLLYIQFNKNLFVQADEN